MITSDFIIRGLLPPRVNMVTFEDTDYEECGSFKMLNVLRRLHQIRRLTDACQQIRKSFKMRSSRLNTTLKHTTMYVGTSVRR